MFYLMQLAGIFPRGTFQKYTKALAQPNPANWSLARLDKVFVEGCLSLRHYGYVIYSKASIG
jgi:hypothetical protein